MRQVVACRVWLLVVPDLACPLGMAPAAAACTVAAAAAACMVTAAAVERQAFLELMVHLGMGWGRVLAQLLSAGLADRQVVLSNPGKLVPILDKVLMRDKAMDLLNQDKERDKGKGHLLVLAVAAPHMAHLRVLQARRTALSVGRTGWDSQWAWAELMRQRRQLLQVVLCHQPYRHRHLLVALTLDPLLRLFCIKLRD